MWLNRHKLNNSLVVFLHGLWGSRFTTWDWFPDLLQSISAERIYCSYDFYLFQYKTGLPRQPPFEPFVLSSLDQFLIQPQVQGKYATIVLICHSQGGVLAKLYVLDKLSTGRGHELKVDMIITLNTPHRGPRFHWKIAA